MDGVSGTRNAGSTIGRLPRSARRRVQWLRSLGADLAELHGATLVKGSVIARHMPAGVLCQSGDVGLVIFLVLAAAAKAEPIKLGIRRTRSHTELRIFALPLKVAPDGSAFSGRESPLLACSGRARPSVRC